MLARASSQPLAFSCLLCAVAVCLAASPAPAVSLPLTCQSLDLQISLINLPDAQGSGCPTPLVVSATVTETATGTVDSDGSSVSYRYDVTFPGGQGSPTGAHITLTADPAFSFNTMTLDVSGPGVSFSTSPTVAPGSLSQTIPVSGFTAGQSYLLHVYLFGGILAGTYPDSTLTASVSVLPESTECALLVGALLLGAARYRRRLADLAPRSR